ncbi:hypothetical protein ACFX2K_019466 [Malus domestica]
MKVWWKQFINKRKRKGGKVVSEVSKPDTEILKQFRMKYLATGGEDGVVRIWHVTLVDASSNYLTPQGIFDSKLKKIKYGFQVIFPEKGFRIQESPLQEFHGHSSDVLDLAWSNSNCLVSSSMDKTVRLWEVGRSHCLYIFHHNDYGKCFNPRDDNYFISGSIDGKVRVWGPSEKRVVTGLMVSWLVPLQALATSMKYQGIIFSWLCECIFMVGRKPPATKSPESRFYTQCSFDLFFSTELL